MSEARKNLGKLIAVHPIAPAYVQRAVFIAALSFIFFLAMMFAFYLRGNFPFFILASAFLVIYLVMMFSIVMQRRSVAEVFDGGLGFRNNQIAWDEMAEISEIGVVELKNGKQIVLPQTLSDFEKLVAFLRSRATNI